MSSTQCKDTKSYEHVNEHTTERNILTENYHTQQENANSITLQIILVSDILLGFISLLNADEVNGKPTIQGFYLKVNQWNYLKRLQKYIDLSIKETT
jgi:hypothetical protein